MTPWTVAHQAPRSMGFSRQEYWSGLPFLSPGNLPNPGLLHCRKTLYPLNHKGSHTREELWLPGHLKLCVYLQLWVSGYFNLTVQFYNLREVSLITSPYITSLTASHTLPLISHPPPSYFMMLFIKESTLKLLVAFSVRNPV